MKYLTISEYARHFGVSRPTIYKRINAGTLPFGPVSVKEKRIMVEDTEYERVKGNASDPVDTL